MSTVISPAFVMPGTDAAEIAARTTQFSQKITKLAQAERDSLIAKMVCHAIDSAIAFGKPWPADPMLEAYRTIDEAGREIEKTGRRHPLYDFEMHISLIPDRVTRSTYGILHTERRRWAKLWLRQPGVRDFSWGNASDRPAHIRASEWSLREETWDRIMPSGIPAHHGFSANISPVRVHASIRQALRRQPSLAARKNAIAKQMLMAEIMPEGEIHPDTVFSQIIRASETLRTEEGLARIAQTAQTVKLPRRIDFSTATAHERPMELPLA